MRIPWSLNCDPHGLPEEPSAVCPLDRQALLLFFVTFYFALILDIQKSCKAGLRRGFDRPGRGKGGQKASWPREW